MKSACGNIEVGQRWKWRKSSEIVEIISLPDGVRTNFGVQVVYSTREQDIGTKIGFYFGDPRDWEYLEGQDRPHS